jgi:hypothetical protein
MTKSNVDAEHARQLEIAHKLLSDVFDGRTTLVRVSGEKSDQLEQIIVATQEEVENQLGQWDSQNHSKFVQEAEKLFDTISTRLGPVVAKEIFKTTAAKRLRGSEYCRGLNTALVYHVAKTKSPTQSARRAIEYGLERPKDEEKLVRRIERLLKRARASQTTGDN